MKHLLTYSLLFIAFTGMSQMYSVPNTIRTPYGNVTTYTNHYMPMYYGGYSLPTVFKRAKLQVVLKNDSVLNIQARFDAGSKQNAITVKGKKGVADKVYQPADTKSVTRSFVTGELPMKGIPADSCWLFKVISGKISCYSNVPLQSEGSIVAIQFENDPIIKLTKDNLLAMIPERDEKFEKLFKKNKFIEAIKLYNKPESVTK
jgi:hypothetical protein